MTSRVAPDQKLLHPHHGFSRFARIVPKKYYWILPLVLGCLLFLPRLGSFGLWDPIEIRDADVAQELAVGDTSSQTTPEAKTGKPAKKGGFLDVTVGGKYNLRPPLYVWLVALGFKLAGINELAGRLPLAMMGILCLLLAYRVGRRLVNEYAGLACAFVLATAPVFLFQSRQLGSDVVYYTSLLAAAGGIAAYIWPASGKSCHGDLIIAGLGLVAGFLSKGLLLGTLFPLLTVGIAIALSWRTPDQEVAGGDSEGDADEPGGSEAHSEYGAEPQAPEPGEEAADEESGEPRGPEALRSRDEVASKEEAEEVGDEGAEEVGDEGAEEDGDEEAEEDGEEAVEVDVDEEDGEEAVEEDGEEDGDEDDLDEDDDFALYEESVVSTLPDPVELPQPEEDPAPDAPTLGQAVVARGKNLGIMLGVCTVVIVGLLLMLKGTKFMILGGTFHRLNLPPTFETIFKSFGFGFYPWFGLLPVALGTFVLAQGKSLRQRDRSAFFKMVILVLIVGGYVVSSFWLGYLGKIRYPAMPWAAMAVGLLVYEIWSARVMAHRYWGLVAMGIVLVLQQDYFMNPDSLAFSHLVEHAKYPIELKIKTEMRVFGIILATLFFLSLGGGPSAIGRNFSNSLLGRISRRVAAFLDLIGVGIRVVLGPYNRHAMAAAGVGALVFAGWCSFYLTPQLSLHLSNKALYQTFHRCRTGGEALAQYQVSGKGAAYYNNGMVKEIHSTEQLFTFLKQDKRWFILVPAHQLAAIDKDARQRKVAYFVLDDRSSQFLILSNKLGQTECKKDRNPLRKYVMSKEPTPRKRIRDRDGKEIRPNFENRVQLLGYDVADTVTRGGKFRLKLYFKVLGSMPSQYKIFIHFDQPASRFHGDHKPLGGKFPTEYWMAGDYILDPHDVEIPFITTPSGLYTMYVGFWLGSQRLKLTDPKHHDGVNRVPLGKLRVR